MNWWDADWSGKESWIALGLMLSAAALTLAILKLLERQSQKEHLGWLKRLHEEAYRQETARHPVETDPSMAPGWAKTHSFSKPERQ